MKRLNQEDDLSHSVIDASAEWVVEFSMSEPDLETRRAFDAWLRRSPEHVRAYIELLPLWDDVRQLDARDNYSIDNLIQMARSDSGNLAALPMRRAVVAPANRGRARRAWIAMAAAAVGLATFAGIWLYGQQDLYSTGIGEQRVVALEDGSSVEMNARSRLRVSYSAGQRLIEMLAGQALFRVANDTRRPFIVVSGDTKVRALGTEFDVYRKANATRVTVLEGRVLVSSATPQVLKSGDQALVTPASVNKAPHPDPQAATAWREHRLIFDSADIGEVADEFNRFNDRQILIRNDGHVPFEVSGAFSVTDLASLIEFLRAQPNIDIDADKHRILVTIKR